MSELDFFESFPRLYELFEAFRNIDWTPERLIGIVVSVLGAIGSLFGIVVKWRNSGSNRATRLAEYLTERDSRVYSARWDLRRIANRPSATSGADANRLCLFEKLALKRLTVERGWKQLFGRKSELVIAIDRANEGLRMAERAKDTARHELFLAHLLRGASLDAQGEHQEALHSFNAALDLMPDDAQALEYAGTQLILLGSPDSAIEHLSLIVNNASREFVPMRWDELGMAEGPVTQSDVKYLARMLVRASLKPDTLSVARAHRTISLAYEHKHPPQLNLARLHARLAVAKYPEDSASAVEVGEAWERLGWLTFRYREDWAGQAITELNQASGRYDRISEPNERKKRQRAVRSLIDRVSGVEETRITLGIRLPIFFREVKKAQATADSNAMPDSQPAK